MQGVVDVDLLALVSVEYPSPHNHERTVMQKYHGRRNYGGRAELSEEEQGILDYCIDREEYRYMWYKITLIVG